MQRFRLLRLRPERLVGSVLLAAVAGFVLGASLRPDVPAHAPARPAAAPRHAVDDGATIAFDNLDPVRMHAMQGNVHASAELAGRLIARFDRSGRPDDLHEGFQWIARDWDQPDFPGDALVQHVVARHCHRAVLRWHLLCATGE